MRKLALFVNTSLNDIKKQRITNGEDIKKPNIRSCAVKKLLTYHRRSSTTVSLDETVGLFRNAGHRLF